MLAIYNNDSVGKILRSIKSYSIKNYAVAGNMVYISCAGKRYTFVVTGNQVQCFVNERDAFTTNTNDLQALKTVLHSVKSKRVSVQDWFIDSMNKPAYL